MFFPFSVIKYDGCPRTTIVCFVGRRWFRICFARGKNICGIRGQLALCWRSASVFGCRPLCQRLRWRWGLQASRFCSWVIFLMRSRAIAWGAGYLKICSFVRWAHEIATQAWSKCTDVQSLEVESPLVVEGIVSAGSLTLPGNAPAPGGLCVPVFPVLDDDVFCHVPSGNRLPIRRTEPNDRMCLPPSIVCIIAMCVVLCQCVCVRVTYSAHVSRALRGNGERIWSLLNPWSESYLLIDLPFRINLRASSRSVKSLPSFSVFHDHPSTQYAMSHVVFQWRCKRHHMRFNRVDYALLPPAGFRMSWTCFTWSLRVLKSRSMKYSMLSTSDSRAIRPKRAQAEDNPGTIDKANMPRPPAQQSGFLGCETVITAATQAPAETSQWLHERQYAPTRVGNDDRQDGQRNHSAVNRLNKH